MVDEDFEQRLTGGHPNSLGNTVEVVETILANPDRLEELYQCYSSSDPVVRLRTSSAMKRVAAVHPEWLAPYLDRFLTDVAALDQASAQWTLAQLFLTLERYMTADQQERAVEVMKRNLDQSDDWIVQNTTIDTLSHWASADDALAQWLVPRLRRFTESHRKSVAGRARKALKAIKA